MTATPEMSAAIVSEASLDDEQSGRDLLSVLCDPRWDFCPRVVSNREPIRNVVHEAIDFALRYWAYPFLWKNSISRGVCLQGSSGHGTKGSITLTVKAGRSSENTQGCFLALAEKLHADYGVLFAGTPDEFGRAAKTGCAVPLDVSRQRWAFGVVARDIESRLPDLYWMTVLGHRLIQLFGRERVLSTPAHSVAEFGDGRVAIQLTEKLTDVWERRTLFLDRVEEAKRHLGRQRFRS